ncbi:MAG: roadblock/LC7 domain-containing protein [Desulfatitalea sp.]|nr:roadblock/LC7 domain-containing protein [Desulfatitalea sp.]
MPAENMDSLTLLKDFLHIDNVKQVLVISKDGFAIESVGNFKSTNMDKLCSSLALAINGMEAMSSDLDLGRFKNMSFEYDDAFIVGAAVKDAVIALIAPDASSLGMMKMRLQKHLPMLSKFY